MGLIFAAKAIMELVGAHWEHPVNVLHIRCNCKCMLYHRADRWVVKCPVCHRSENLRSMRERYLKRKKK